MLTKDDLKNISLIVETKIKKEITPFRKDFENFTIAVKNQFDRVEENIGELKEDISILKTDVAELKTDMKEVKTDLKTLNKIQTSQYHQIDKNTDDIRLLKTKIKLA